MPSEPDSSGLSSHTALRTSSASSPGFTEHARYGATARSWALVGVLLASFAAAALVASPLWIAIVIGVVMAISAHRPYELLRTKLRGRSSLSAGITMLASGVLVAVAGTSIVLALTNELMKLVAHLQEASPGSLGGIIGQRAANAVARLGIDTARVYAWAESELEAAASFVASAAAVIVRTTSHALLGLVVALMTMYYVLLEGPELARRIERIVPLEPRHTRALLVEAREVSRTAFMGTILTAIVQGVLAGIGYAVLGVPQPLTWAVVTALASFIPVIGTLVVWVPIAGYLFLEGHPVRALVLVAYGVLVITSLADYVIRPRIVGGAGHGHPLLTLISLLGGIELFGLAGLIVAPIVMSVFVAAFRIYEREVRAGSAPGTTPAAEPAPLVVSAGQSG